MRTNMDATKVIERLNLTRKHILTGARLVAEQAARIAEQRKLDLDTEEDELLLAQLEEVQFLHQYDAAQLRLELERLARNAEADAA
jgi:hypothetical protein